MSSPGVTVWQVLLGVVAGLVVMWAVLVVTLYLGARRQDEPARLRDVLRLLPDVLRLLHRLAADPALPRGVRWRLSVVVFYLLLPIDVVPDFIPVVGYADDAVVVALGLRWVIKAAGAEALDRHWTGTPQGLAVVKRLAGVRESG